MKPITIEAKKYNCIMELTNDFVSSNVLPKHKIIKIITQQLDDKWISNIYYNNKV